VLAIKKLVGDITVGSLWLLKKTISDDGFQEWHQDMKHKITKTIVVNVGLVAKGDYKDLLDLCSDTAIPASPDLVLMKIFPNNHLCIPS
jgi:hypothetical protein